MSISEGYIVCARLGCPRPTATDELLQDSETYHIVLYEVDGYTVRHPLHERLDDALFHCEIHEYVASNGPRPVGAYRATPRGENDWTFEKR